MTNESELESALKFLAAEGQKCDRMDAMKELLAKVDGIEGRGRSVWLGAASLKRQNYGRGLVDAANEIRDEIVAAHSGGEVMAGYHCKKRGGDMNPSKAIAQTYVGGMLDFDGDTHSSTFSAGGPGQLIECLKCERCGWSKTPPTPPTEGDD